MERQEGQKSSKPGNLADQGREVLPPPVGNTRFGPPPLASIPLLPEAGGTRKMRLWNSRTTGKREDQNHREEGRVEGEKGMMTSGRERDVPHAQWPRGPADIYIYIYIYASMDLSLYSDSVSGLVDW